MLRILWFNFQYDIIVLDLGEITVQLQSINQLVDLLDTAVELYQLYHLSNNQAKLILSVIVLQIHPVLSQQQHPLLEVNIQFLSHQVIPLKNWGYVCIYFIAGDFHC